jgi:hypothetical protein
MILIYLVVSIHMEGLRSSKRNVVKIIHFNNIKLYCTTEEEEAHGFKLHSF